MGRKDNHEWDAFVVNSTAEEVEKKLVKFFLGLCNWLEEDLIMIEENLGKKKLLIKCIANFYIRMIMSYEEL